MHGLPPNIRYISSILVAFCVAFFPFIVEAAQSKKRQPPKAQTASYSKVAGFRSAHFGMTEKQVRKVIAKDFGKFVKTISKVVHRVERTTAISVDTNNLVSEEGKSRVSYILGYKSRKLVQINVGMGFPFDKKASAASVISAANLLRGHFLKKNYPKEGLVVNARINKQTVLVFRAIDEGNAGIVLTLQTHEIPPKNDKKKKESTVSLQLSYIKDVKETDIFTLKDSAF